MISYSLHRLAITRTQIDAATEALRLVLRLERPADAVLHDFFRARRALGARDRAFVASAVYGVLRRRRTMERLASGGEPRRLLLAWLARGAGSSVRDLAPLIGKEEAQWLARVKAEALDGLPLAVRAELPDWLFERLARSVSGPELLALARGLNEEAPLDLRVNTLCAERGEVLRVLAASGIAAEPTPYSPVGLRVRGRPPINRHPLFLEGKVEVQDEGSQLLCYLVGPKRREIVVDFCAGAGGKSLLLGALMHSLGRVYAFDVSAARLARLGPRLKRSGLSNLHPRVIRNENDPHVKRLGARADRVLVDAPCSGLGTARRNPDLKWRQSPRSVAELALKQASILRAAAGLVKSGGRLVYATCSLLAEENEEIVAAFLAERGDFRELHCGELLGQQGIPLDTGRHLKLFPHVHETDGFFAAALIRNAGSNMRSGFE